MVSAVDVPMGCDSSQIQRDLLSQGHTTFSSTSLPYFPSFPLLPENNMQHKKHVGSQERVVTVHVL